VISTIKERYAWGRSRRRCTRRAAGWDCNLAAEDRRRTGLLAPWTPGLRL